jgi:hypothetical protein
MNRRELAVALYLLDRIEAPLTEPTTDEPRPIRCAPACARGSCCSTSSCP